MALRCKILLFAFCLLAVQAPAAIMSGPIMRTISGSSSSLNTSLIAYWKLDEASGTRVDSEPTGTAQNLTDVNTVTSNTGIIGNAAQFTASNSEYLSRADNADLSTGDIAFSITAWVYLDSKASSKAIVSKYLSTGNQREYNMEYNFGSDRFRFAVSGDGTALTVVNADVLGSPSTSTWYFITAYHDPVSNLIGISANNGAFTTTAHTTGCFDGTATFNLGALGNPTQFFDGRIDEVGFWKKVLSAGEITELYNAGAGKTCCPF